MYAIDVIPSRRCGKSVTMTKRLVAIHHADRIQPSSE